MNFLQIKLNWNISCFTVFSVKPMLSKNYSSSSKDIVFKKIKPVVVYYNADIDKLNILADNQKAGVYRWVNKLNLKTYIGSSINLRVRMYTYYSLRSLAESNRPIDRALLKYGFSNFSLEILEYCEQGEVLEKEQYYLDRLKPSYNIVQTAGSTLGYKHTLESLAKMRNFVLSDEVKERKTKAAIKAGKANRVPILVENVLTNEITEHVSMTEAGKALGVHRNAIVYAVAKNGLVKKTYRVKKKKID